MSERDDRYVGNDSPSSTAEFRAAPDASASTAEFRAFAAGQDARAAAQRADGFWPEQPWAGQAPSRGSSRMMLLVIGAVVVVAIVIAILLIG
ncbi:MAG TPA: hypothetical protein VLX31_15710 [Streptosporangiaceae bacterium]|nr:hypothetical protein [Streptosporangiaceae bacterium]